MAQNELAQGRPEAIDVDDLELDPENPRLASKPGQQALSQEQIIKTLWSDMAVDEIAFSIAKNGFYQHEPLLVVPEKKGGGAPYVVIEGNRRLAAVRLLRDKHLRAKVKATELPAISADERKKLDSLPVLIFPEKKGLWAYLGFRHVNGTKPWDALSKAEFVAEVHEKYRVPLTTIADRIGDRHTTVLRLYRGYTVLKQAERDTGFSRTDLWRNRFYFSHLYTALDQPEFQKFLGIKATGELDKDPVPKKKRDQLRELMTWLYGKKSEALEPVVRTQNPDLNNLRTVIANAQSLSLLRQGYPLEHAFEFSQGDESRFRDAVVRAKDALQKAKGTVTTGYVGQRDLLSAMEAIVTTATSLLEEMKRTDMKQPARRS